MKKLLFLFFIFFLNSCNQDEIEFPFKGDGTQINIYLVKDGQLEHSSDEVDIESLELEKIPWLKHSEIEFYDWSSHIFYLKNEKNKEEHSGKHFVISANQKSLMRGLFFPSYMSSMPQFPSIIAHDDFFYPMDLIGLGGYGFYENEDSKIDFDGFRIALENSGLLKEGIEVEITELRRENSTTLKYTFKVTNLDLDNIYILDPDKMGVSRFHYYTNGVHFRKGDKHYFARDIETTSSDNIEPDWYNKLAPGQSMTRTVKLDAYESLPTGSVTAYFNFPGVHLKNKGEWKKYDGRIWLGDFRVNKELNLN